MEKYNYREQVKSDVLDYIAENGIKVTASNREEVAVLLHDELWANDSVTGNASGSYTCNAWEAEENICHNLDLLKEALEEFGSNIADLDSAEMCDVTIRCYLLGECIDAALDEVEEEEKNNPIFALHLENRGGSERYRQGRKLSIITNLKQKRIMSYECIKNTLMEECPHIWAWWTEDIRDILSGEELIRKYKDARMQIKKELEDRILTEQKYFAEYELLCLLSGIREPLNFSNFN